MTGVLLQAAGTESIIGAVFAFLVSLLIGTVAINAGARVFVDSDAGYRRAAFTALVGAVAWAVVAFFVGFIPLLGPLLALVAWVGIINWRYQGGWATAAGIGGVAWVVALVLLYGLSALGVVGLDALGIPGA